MIKVAYDISTLGQGYINPKAKTGIYRVVESLFFELLKQKEIELTTLAYNQLSSIWEHTSSFLYLKNQHPELILSFNYCLYSKTKIETIYESALKVQKTLIKKSLQKLPLFYKPSIALQIPFKKLAEFDVYSKLDFKQFHVYHSPFYAFPKEETSQKLSRIITIYDLIPILYPENFTKNILEKFKLVINSINYQKDWIICISENTKQDFCEYTGMNPERVFVTPLAAEKHFYPITEQKITDNTLQQYKIPKSPYLLSLCTLEPRKNLSFLIQCFSKIINQQPNLDLNLVLVGVSGWKNADIFQAAQANSLLKNRIIFTGYIPDEDLSAIYSGATAFIYPSLYEGFGLPPLEAMKCGTPVITSNTSSLPEVVGDAGIMINPKEQDTLCQAILDITNDSNLRAKLSQKGLERANQFSWQKCAEETVKVYQIAVENKES